MKAESGGANGKAREEEQAGMSVHSPCKAPPSSASSLPKVLCRYICDYCIHFVWLVFELIVFFLNVNLGAISG